MEGGISYLDNDRTLFTDRLFTSPVLASELLPFKTYVVGTVVAGRQFLPQDICKEKMNRNVARGTIKFRHADELSYCNFYDNNVVKMLYTDKEFVEQISVVKRKDRVTGAMYEMNMPDVVGYYQQFMRGVDMA